MKSYRVPQPTAFLTAGVYSLRKVGTTMAPDKQQDGRKEEQWRRWIEA
jgi:hypothetical protein